jgi:hypothetical protein
MRKEEEVYEPTLADIEEVERQEAEEKAKKQQSSQQGYQPTQEDWERAFRETEGIETNPAKNRGAWGNFSTGLGAGAVEGIANIAPSLLNAVIKPTAKLFGKDYGLPYVDLSSIAGNTRAGKAGQLTGHIGSLIMPGAAATKLLTKLLGAPGLLKTVGATSAAGGLLSGSEHELMSRGIGAALGAVPFGHGIRNKTVVGEAGKRAKELESHFNEAYSNIFDEADRVIPTVNKLPNRTEEIEELTKKIKEVEAAKNPLMARTPLQEKQIAALQSEIRGAKRLAKEEASKALKIPEAISTAEGRRIFNALPGAKQAINKFMENPTPRFAHELQSDLREIVHKFNSSNVGKHPGSAKRDAADAAMELRRDVQNNLQSAFEKNGLGELGQEYKIVSNDYREKMVPYLIEALQKHLINPKGTTSKQVMKEMIKKQGEIGRADYYKELPGFELAKYKHLLWPKNWKKAATEAIIE